MTILKPIQGIFGLTHSPLNSAIHNILSEVMLLVVVLLTKIDSAADWHGIITQNLAKTTVLNLLPTNELIQVGN